MESPKRPSKLTFVVLNFVAAISPGAWHCKSNDIIDTHTLNLTRDLLYYYAMLTETWINKHEIKDYNSVEDAIS